MMNARVGCKILLLITIRFNLNDYMISVCDIYIIFVKISENRGEFLEKLQRAKSQIKPGTASQPILSRQSQTRLVVGNWSLTCRKDSEIHIHNSDGQQVRRVGSSLVVSKREISLV